LRRLGRERVDLYLLHEPELELLDTDEWSRWLESERDRVARFGIAVDAPRLKKFIEVLSTLTTVIQTVDSVRDCEADILRQHNRPLQITYGYFRAAQLSGPVDVQELLGAALRRNQYGSIIVSTRNAKRLQQYSAIADAVGSAATSAPIDSVQ
jgi:aryl-alcohol dehydrogenase-like predicted oxidoreductase